MIVTALNTFRGRLDLSANPILQDLNEVEALPFQLTMVPGQVATVDDKFYTLRSMQSAMSAGLITIQITVIVHKFTDLSDVPSSYFGQANKIVTVNAAETGLVFTAGGAVGGTTFKVSSADTTANYGENKIVAGTGITINKLNTGGNESLSIALYVSPTVSLSGGSTNEIGTTVANVALSWTVNKTMTSRLLSAPVPVPDRDQGAGGNGSYAHTGANLTSTTAYTITVNDGTTGTSSSSSVYFLNRRYYGVNVLTTVTNSDVLALSKEFISSRSNTHVYDCTGGRYIWICYPASFGAATFYVGGLETTFTLFTQNITNDSGYTESYYCYRSTELQNGSNISVVVS